jgi:hypothetical protein
MALVDDLFFRERRDLAITRPLQRLRMKRETAAIERTAFVDLTDLKLQGRREKSFAERKECVGVVGEAGKIH